MRQRELVEVMSIDELYEWLAFDTANDPEFRKQTLQQDDLERQKNQSAEEEAARIKAFFMSLKPDGA